MPETVSLQEAARRLGVSERTVRRRIKDGTLVGREMSTPQGYRWLVDLPDRDLVAADSTAWRQLVDERDFYREQVLQLRRDVEEIKRLLVEAAADWTDGKPAPLDRQRRHWWEWFVWTVLLW